MKRFRLFMLYLFLLPVIGLMIVEAGIRNKEKDSEDQLPEARSYSDSRPATGSASPSSEDDLSAIGEELISKEATRSPSETPKSSTGKRRADAFIAGPDWEFDGFVSGGQDQDIKSMFATNDLVYLNIGSDQGLKPGDRLGVYRRGNRVRDPQTGRMLGYEVKKLGIGEVTDLVDSNTSSVRLISANQSVEIGDLVRKE